MSSLFGKSKRKKSSLKEESTERKNVEQNLSLTTTSSTLSSPPNTNDYIQQHISTFSDLKLIPPLQQTCRSLGYKTPTPIQKSVIPFLLRNTSSHILALATTGSGKTATFVLPILHHLSVDPYGIYAVILTPTRELAKQIYEQVLALGASLRIKACLTIGGMDMTQQACELSNKPHICVATPGRLGALLRGPNPPVLRNVRYVVLDEADRLLNAKSGFQGDVAEVLLHGTTIPKRVSSDDESEDDDDNDTDNENSNDTDSDNIATNVKRERRNNCQTLLFSATLTKSLESLEEMAGGQLGRLPLQKFVEQGDGVVACGDDKMTKKRKKDNNDDGDVSGSDDSEEEEEELKLSTPKIPAGLRQEYIFMPSHVRDAYLITAVRHLMANGGRRGGGDDGRRDGSGWNDSTGNNAISNDNDDEDNSKAAKSAIIFVSTCERTALISGVLTELGVSNVALHSLLTQNRRLASLAKFKSQHCRVLVATDVASRGLDIPTVDLVLNCELPRRAVDYIHRVGRTARAGRRGRAVSLVCERDVSLVHACEKMSGREMKKCNEVTDDLAVKMLGSVTKATRLTKMKLADIGFDELVKKMKERKIRDKKLRERSERAASKIFKKSKSK
jgi:ATP-dependent RNA helicase DDX49/DBP8